MSFGEGIKTFLSKNRGAITIAFTVATAGLIGVMIAFPPSGALYVAGLVCCAGAIGISGLAVGTVIAGQENNDQDLEGANVEWNEQMNKLIKDNASDNAEIKQTMQAMQLQMAAGYQQIDNLRERMDHQNQLQAEALSTLEEGQQTLTGEVRAVRRVVENQNGNAAAVQARARFAMFPVPQIPDEIANQQNQTNGNSFGQSGN